MIQPSLLTFIAWIPIVAASIWCYWAIFWWLPYGIMTCFDGKDKKERMIASAWFHGVVISIALVIFSWYYLTHKDEYSMKYNIYIERQQYLNQ